MFSLTSFTWYKYPQGPYGLMVSSYLNMRSMSWYKLQIFLLCILVVRTSTYISYIYIIFTNVTYVDYFNFWKFTVIFLTQIFLKTSVTLIIVFYYILLIFCRFLPPLYYEPNTGAQRGYYTTPLSCQYAWFG